MVRVLTRMNIGGPAIHAAVLSNRLDPARFSTALVTGVAEANEGDLSHLVDASRVRVIRVASLRRPLKPLADLRTLARLTRILWRERPHIIHTHTAKAGCLGRVAGLLYNHVGPGRAAGQRAWLLHTFHGHVLEGYFSPRVSRFFITIERWLAHRCDGLIGVSPTVRDELLALGIGAPQQWRVIELGLDLASLSQIPLPANGAPPVRVGLIGRLVPIKNPGLFLEALAQLNSRDANRSVQGVVVGDGPLRPSLEALARQLRLQETMTFLGWQQDLRRVYEQVDIGCLTSWNEGTPVALIEAMAAGRPVVATAVGGVRDLLEGDSRSRRLLGCGEVQVAPRGLLIRPGDVEALARALQMLTSDPALRARLGQAGRSYVMERFAANRLLDDMTAMYEDLEARRAA